MSASSLYGTDYARRYREHDDQLQQSKPYHLFAEWLRSVCRQFAQPIDVLDLGCGTGRYFSALTGVRELTGIDASAAMLDQARHPYNAAQVTAASVSLLHGDLLTYDFAAARFDLVYSVGVLAEHVPLGPALVARVARWLAPGGRFAFTTVHPASPSIPRTLGRRVGEWIEPVTFGPLRRGLRGRMLAHGWYADEERVHELLDRSFVVESLARVVSEAHLHCLCVARKAGDR